MRETRAIFLRNVCLEPVESKRERMKKLNCLSIQEKENTKLIHRKKTILGEAEYHNRSPKPSTSAAARPPPQHGGRRGWWGQARPMGAVSHRPHARAFQHQTLGKPPGQIPSQHSPFGPRLSRRNETKPKKQTKA